jgi:hypothetical protein
MGTEGQASGIARRRRETVLFQVAGFLIFVALSIPADCRAENAADVDVNHEACADSIVALLAASQELQGVAGKPSDSAARSESTPALSDGCVESFVEQLAEYEEQHQVQRGKPPPPPPPSDGAPAARAWHAFTSNGSGVVDASRLYLFGGAGSDWQALPADLWYYRVDKGTWNLAPTGSTIPGRRQHMGFSCSVGQCVTSNGFNGISALKETWIYTAASASWSQVNCKRKLCPSARAMPAMAYDSARAAHLLFGGLDGSGSLDDTYVFAGGLWNARSPVNKPAARDRAAAVFVGSTGNLGINSVVLFGGQQNESKTLCDMFAWTGSNWQAVSAANKGPCLHSHSMAWDGNRIIVTGGYVDTSDTPSNDVWYFTFTSTSSGQWTKAGDGLAQCALAAKPGARMAYDLPSGKSVFFGGEENRSPGGVVRYANTVVCP